MPRKAYIVNIENPCSESWQEMSLADGGKFCARCSKTVIDFSTLSDDAIIKILSQQKGNVCGRFQTDQLNKELIESKQIRSSKGFYKYLAGLLLLGISKNAFSNNIKLSKENIVTNPVQQKNIEEGFYTDTLTRIIKGRIMDSSTSLPVVGASLMINNSKIGTQTDSLGYFSLHIPKKINCQNIIVTISHIDYEVKEVPNQYDSLKQIYLTPKFNSLSDIAVIGYQNHKTISMTMGETLFVSSHPLVAHHKKHWWQFWK